MKTNRIRVVHVSQSSGGVERYLLSFLKYADHESFEHILIASQDYHKDKFIRTDISLVESYHEVYMIRPIRPNRDIPSILNIRRLLKNLQPDVVYFHSSKGGALGRIANWGLMKTRSGRKKISIYNPHGWAFNMRTGWLKRNVYKWIERILALFTDKIICISEAERRSAIENRICPAEKLTVINNGIDFEEYLEPVRTGNYEISRSKLNIPNDAFIVGAVGRLSEQKAPDVFVEAARLIREQIPNAYFIIVGDGDDEASVLQLIDRYDLSDSFLITEWVEYPMAYIQLFDVAVLLSRWEGFGLVLPEYMLAGKPIVASNVDAIPYIIKDGINGLLVKVDNAEEAADAVERLNRDKDLREKLIENSRKIVKEKYSIKRVIRETEELIVKCEGAI